MNKNLGSIKRKKKRLDIGQATSSFYNNDISNNKKTILSFLYYIHILNEFYLFEMQKRERAGILFHRDLEKQSDMSKTVRTPNQYTQEPTDFVVPRAAYEL